MTDEPNHCVASTLPFYAVPLDPDIAFIHLQNERPRSIPTPEYRYSKRIHRSYYVQRDNTTCNWKDIYANFTPENSF